MTAGDDHRCEVGCKICLDEVLIDSKDFSSESVIKYHFGRPCQVFKNPACK